MVKLRTRTATHTQTYWKELCILNFSFEKITLFLLRHLQKETFHFTQSTSSFPIHSLTLNFHTSLLFQIYYMYIYKYQSTPWRWYSYMHFAPFALNSSKYKTGVSSFWFVFYGFAVLNFVIGCDFCVGLICFPSLMCNCFVCCGGGGCCVVVSRFLEYSHLYPTVSKDTALCAGVRPCVARRCHGEWGLVSWDSYPAASSTSATTFPSATFHFLWL